MDIEYLLGIATSPLLVVPILVAAAVSDWRTYRIPNVLSIGGAALGFALSWLPGGVTPALSATGAAIVLALLLPLWLLRVTGAGDVKLMAMTGTFLGWPGVMFALLFTMIAGGIAALAFAAWRRRVPHLFANTGQVVQASALAALLGVRPRLEVDSLGRLPYAACICIGTCAWLLLHFTR